MSYRNKTLPNVKIGTTKKFQIQKDVKRCKMPKTIENSSFFPPVSLPKRPWSAKYTSTSIDNLLFFIPSSGRNLFLFLLTSFLWFIENIFREKCNYYAKPAFHSLFTEKSVLRWSVSASPKKMHSKNLIDFLWILTKKILSRKSSHYFLSPCCFLIEKKMQFCYPKDVSCQNKKNPSINIE